MTEPSPTADSMTGGCHCGAARYTAIVRSDDAYLCHCEMCRRSSGNVSLAMVQVTQADVIWESGPDWYRSSAIAERPYCAQCGSSLGFRYVDSDKMDLTVGSFDDPARFRPVHNFSTETMLSHWLDVSALPGQRLDEYKPLMDKWDKAIRGE